MPVIDGMWYPPFSSHPDDGISLEGSDYKGPKSPYPLTLFEQQQDLQKRSSHVLELINDHCKRGGCPNNLFKAIWDTVPVVVRVAEGEESEEEFSEDTSLTNCEDHHIREGRHNFFIETGERIPDYVDHDLDVDEEDDHDKADKEDLIESGRDVKIGKDVDVQLEDDEDEDEPSPRECEDTRGSSQHFNQVSSPLYVSTVLPLTHRLSRPGNQGLTGS